MSHQTPHRREIASTDESVDLPVVAASLTILLFLAAFGQNISIQTALSQVELPRHSSKLVEQDRDRDTIILLIAGEDRSQSTVILGDDLSGTRITDPDEQAALVESAVVKGLRDGKDRVLIKAEKKVPLRHISRIAAAATVDGVKVNLSVLSKDPN